MRLSAEEERQARAILRAGPLDAVVRTMTDRFFGRADDADPGRAAAEALGWLDPGSGRFTERGRAAADSCREYRFWIERDRRLPFERGAPPLAAAHFAGRTTVEVGCGMGANLMSIAAARGRCVGIEPVPIYRQLGDIFREIAGLAPVGIHEGSGEAIPVGDGEADIVLCVTAHQYMDVRAALAEMARILRPGGELILIGGTLGAYLRGVSGSGLRADAITIANTLGYMAAGRRPIPPRGPSSTSRPVYPTTGHILRLLRRAGLAPAGTVQLGQETGFFASRP